MPDSDLQLTFGADASGVTQGVEQATASIDGFGPRIEALGASLGDLASNLKESLAGLNGLARGFQSAGAQSSTGLAALTEAGGGAVDVIAAVSGAAPVAAGALAGMSHASVELSASISDAIAGSWVASAQSATQTVGAAAEAVQQHTAAIDTAMDALASHDHEIVERSTFDWTQWSAIVGEMLGKAAPPSPPRTSGAAGSPAAPAAPAPQPAAVASSSEPLAQATGDQQQLTAANAKGIEDRARDNQRAASEDLAASRAVLSEKVAAIQLSAAEGTITATQAAAQIAGIRQQAVQDQLKAVDQVYQSELAALAKRLALYPQDSAAYERVLDEEARLAERYSDQITKLKADALKQQDDARKADLEKLKREWSSAVDPLVSSFTKGMLQMAEGAKSFSQVMNSLGQQILNDFLAKVIDPMIEQWLWKETRQTAATLLGVGQRTSAETVANSAGQGQALAQTLLTVKQDAAKVFGGIFAALSSNPVTLPAAAPAAAAGAAAVMSFSYAAGGWADVPADNMPTLLHAQEMVLPARLANPMRSMMDDYATSRAAPWSQPAQASGGDTHVHNYNISAMDAGSFQSFLRGNKNPLSTVLQEMGRAGMKTA